MAFPDLKAEMVKMAERHKPGAVVIEDKASGISLLQSLVAETRLPVVPFRPDGDKDARAHAVQFQFEAGKVIFPKSAPWLASFCEELERFPVADHDDQVDALTMALTFARFRFRPMQGPLYHTFTIDNRPEPDDTGLYAELGVTA